VGVGIVLANNPANAGGQSPQFSSWEFSSYKAPSGKFYCSIISAVSNKNIGQNIVIKGSPLSNHLVIDLYKDKWNRQQGSTVNVIFDFVNNQPLTLPAYADAHILDIELPTEYTASFLLELAERSALQVIFPDDDEDTWVVSGQNAKDAVNKMVSCLRASR
jgi:hypothetical protein